MTDMFGEAWSPMSVPDLAPDDDDDLDNFAPLVRMTLCCCTFNYETFVEARLALLTCETREQ